MIYLNLVQNCHELFGGLLKLAIDLAKILDHPLFQITDESKNNYGSDPTAKRQVAFNQLCAICLKSGIELPKMEIKLLQSITGVSKIKTEHQAQAETLKTRVLELIGTEHEDIKSLATVLSVFPMCFDGYSSLNAEKIQAMINLKLMEAGLEPLRPDYVLGKFPTNRTAPHKLIRVLVVDDSIEAAMTTMINLSGWHNLDVDLFHFNPSERSQYSVSAEKKQELINGVCMEIETRQPNVVLMDQGMNPIEGSDIVREMKKRDSTIIFVGNTDGGDEKLISAGTTETCRKGERWGILDRVFQNL